jgi:hypothetical protein
MVLYDLQQFILYRTVAIQIRSSVKAEIQSYVSDFFDIVF